MPTYNSPMTPPQLLQKGVPAYLFGNLNMLQGDARGYVQQTAVASLGTPTAPSGTPTTGTGSLGAATYFAKIVAINAAGHSLPGTESAGVVLSATGEIAWTWAAVTGATSYQLWVGTSSGAENTFVAVAGTSYTQTAALTSGTIPATDTSNVGSVTVQINQGPVPKVGDLLTVWGTALQSGLFNVTRALVTAVSITGSTGVGTISFALTGTNQAATADPGAFLSEPGESSEAISGSMTSQAVLVQAPQCDSQFTLPLAVTASSGVTAMTATLQVAIHDIDAEYTNTTTVVTKTGATTYTAGPVVQATLQRGYFYRLAVTAVTGSGTIVAKVG